MFAVLAASLFSVVAILTMLAACGAPLGEFTMGGQYKVLPPFFRIMAGGFFVDSAIWNRHCFAVGRQYSPK